MRKHYLSFSSNQAISGCTIDTGTLCDNTTRSILQSGTSHTIDSCEFNGISTEFQNGGAIYLHSDDSSDSTTLTVSMCHFELCNTTSDFSDRTGGGAVYMDCGTRLSVSSSMFICCSTESYGGGVYAQTNCNSAEVSSCAFIACGATAGGGFMTFFGPTSTVSSSYFLSCEASKVGGGLYHDSYQERSHFVLSDSLFAHNCAKYGNTSDEYTYRGGGAFEDWRALVYTSKYSFSFFTGNTAPKGVGSDISVVHNVLLQSPLTHCFTTTAINAFWNNGSFITNWLPLTCILEYLDKSHRTHTATCTNTKTEIDINIL